MNTTLELLAAVAFVAGFVTVLGVGCLLLAIAVGIALPINLAAVAYRKWRKPWR